MKHIIMYHANCIDGFSSAYIAEKFLTLGMGVQAQSVKLIPIEYQKVERLGELEELLTLHGVDNVSDNKFYILDFSFNRQLTAHLRLTAKRVIWLDHHKTAFEMMERYDSQFYSVAGACGVTTLDKERSGARLTFDYFASFSFCRDIEALDVGKLKRLAEFVDDYDRWQFKLDRTRAVNAYLRSIPATLEDWDKALELSLADIMRKGAAMLEAFDAQVAQLLKINPNLCYLNYATEEGCSSEPCTGLALNVPGMFSSVVGHELSKLSGTFGCTWTLAGDEVKVSLRSEGDFDVSNIAKFYGGGGHKNAAGFTIGIDDFFDEILSCMVRNKDGKLE